MSRLVLLAMGLRLAAWVVHWMLQQVEPRPWWQFHVSAWALAEALLLSLLIATLIRARSRYSLWVILMPFLAGILAALVRLAGSTMAERPPLATIYDALLEGSIWCAIGLILAIVRPREADMSRSPGGSDAS